MDDHTLWKTVPGGSVKILDNPETVSQQSTDTDLAEIMVWLSNKIKKFDKNEFKNSKFIVILKYKLKKAEIYFEKINMDYINTN